MQHRKVPSSPVSIFLGREDSARGGGRGTMGSNPTARFLAEAVAPAAESRKRDLFSIGGFGMAAAVALGAGWTAPEEDSLRPQVQPRCGSAGAAARPYWDPELGWGEGQSGGRSAESSPHGRRAAPPASTVTPQVLHPSKASLQLQRQGIHRGFI